ncbi:MAG TPA: phosphate acyltransferase, partial [Azospira sp.]|nr:phosphate acyltransferase [Azospira sp.]
LEADGEMHGDTALSEDIRHQCDPESPLKGEANVLVMPNLDAANISYNLLKMTGGEGITIGPILLGVAKPVHVLTSTATVRRLVNMTALTVIETRQKK